MKKIRNYHPLNTVSSYTELDSVSSMRFLISVLALATATTAYSPLLPPKPARSFPQHSPADVGEPLFLTPYIEAGDLETARGLARVDATLLEGSHSDIESYAGLITVDAANNGNMFFWFFPAEENPETAPVVIWLQVYVGWNLPAVRRTQLFAIGQNFVNKLCPITRMGIW